MLSLVLLATAANGRINIQLDSSGGLITGDGNGIITDTFGPGLSDRGGARPFPSLTTPAVAEEAPPPFIDIVLTPTVVPDPLPMPIYKRYPPGNLQEAYLKCETHGGELAAPTDKKSNAALKLFMKKNRLSRAWLAIQDTGGGFYNPISPNNIYRNWAHHNALAGPNAALGNITASPSFIKIKLPDHRPVWLSRGAQEKRPFICVKKTSFYKEEDTVDVPIGVPSWGFGPPSRGPSGFAGNRLPGRGPLLIIDKDPVLLGDDEDPGGYKNTTTTCRSEWVKSSRYFNRNVCMKYFPEPVTFNQAWKKCAGIEGYIPCPKSGFENDDMRDALNRAVQDEMAKLEDYAAMGELPEIWLSVKKVGDKWNCKEPTITGELPEHYWGFKDEKPTVIIKDKFNDVNYNFDTEEMFNKTTQTWETQRSQRIQAVMNSNTGDWTMARNDWKFDTVCQFRTNAIAKAKEGLAGDTQESGLVFVPEGTFDYSSAVKACDVRDGVLYNPETAVQRKMTLKFIERARADDYVRVTGQQPNQWTFYGTPGYWVGFSQNKLDTTAFATNPESVSPRAGRMVPDIQQSYGRGWYRGEEYHQSTLYNGTKEMSQVSHPIFNSYATLRFQQSYTMQLESIERDNRDRWNATGGTSTNRTLDDTVYWGTQLGTQRTRVFCEIKASRTRMFGEMPCKGKTAFEAVYFDRVCLHMKMDEVFTYDEAQAYCEKLDPKAYIWLPQSTNEERHVFNLFVARMKDLNLETWRRHRAQCNNNRMMCHFTALWDRITASDVADGGYTRITWLGTRMGHKSGSVSKWVLPAPNRFGAKEMSLTRNTYTNWRAERAPTPAEVKKFAGPGVKRTQVIYHEGVYKNDYPSGRHGVLCKPKSDSSLAGKNTMPKHYI